MIDWQIFAGGIALLSIAAGCIYRWSQIVHPPATNAAANGFLSATALLLLAAVLMFAYALGVIHTLYFWGVAAAVTVMTGAIIMWRRGWRPQRPWVQVREHPAQKTPTWTPPWESQPTVKAVFDPNAPSIIPLLPRSLTPEQKDRKQRALDKLRDQVRKMQPLINRAERLSSPSAWSSFAAGKSADYNIDLLDF